MDGAVSERRRPESLRQDVESWKAIPPGACPGSMHPWYRDGTMTVDGTMDPEYLVRLANARMPFGKYAGRLLIDLPEAYVVWFSHKGYPRGEIGELLEALYAIKENGLESLLRPLVGING